MQEFVTFIIVGAIVVIELIMRFVAFRDFYKTHDQRKKNEVLIWAFVILLINFGWLIYFLFGKIPAESEKDETWD